MEKLVKLSSKIEMQTLKQFVREQAFSLSTFKIVSFVFFLAIVIVVPALVHVQWYSGPVINAVLIMACVLVGPMEAMLLGLIPSTVALSSGLLPLPLAPMVPFIMMANAIFIAFFAYTYKTNYWLALLLAAILKFGFLALTVKFVMSAMLADSLVQRLAVMMSWPQLVTALLGGVIAFAILKFLEKNQKK